MGLYENRMLRVETVFDSELDVYIINFLFKILIFSNTRCM